MGEAKEGRVFLFLVVSPGGVEGGGGLSFLFVAGYLCVFVFGFGFVSRLSAIGNRQEGRFGGLRETERGPGLWFFVSQRWERRTSRVSVYGKYMRTLY